MYGDLTYRGIRLIVPPAADIANGFLERHQPLVQEALDAFAAEEDDKRDKPWGRGEDPIFTLEGLTPRDGLATNVVALGPRERERVTWAIHSDHIASHPELSPFVRRPMRPLAASLTIELGGTAEAPRLTRVYAGEYIPPLPWMDSARSADGGLSAAKRYWRSHAYVTTTQLAGSSKAPDWFA